MTTTMSHQSSGSCNTVMDALSVLHSASSSALLPYKIDVEIINIRTTQQLSHAGTLVLEILGRYYSVAQLLVKASTIAVTPRGENSLIGPVQEKGATHKQTLPRGLFQHSLAGDVAKWFNISRGRDLLIDMMTMSNQEIAKTVEDFLDHEKQPQSVRYMRKDIKHGLKLLFCERNAGYGVLVILIHCYTLLDRLPHNQLQELLFLIRSSKSISALARRHESWAKDRQNLYVDQSSVGDSCRSFNIDIDLNSTNELSQAKQSRASRYVLIKISRENDAKVDIRRVPFTCSSAALHYHDQSMSIEIPQQFPTKSQRNKTDTSVQNGLIAPNLRLLGPQDLADQCIPESSKPGSTWSEPVDEVVHGEMCTYSRRSR